MADFPTYDQYGDQTVRSINDCAGLTKSSETCIGASASLVTATTSRVLVIITNALSNSVVAIDPTGGTCALDTGIVLDSGDTIQIMGRAFQSATTQFGTNTQKLKRSSLGGIPLWNLDALELHLRHLFGQSGKGHITVGLNHVTDLVAGPSRKNISWNFRIPTRGDMRVPE